MKFLSGVKKARHHSADGGLHHRGDLIIRKPLDLAPGTYDVKVVGGPVFAWHEGARVKDGKPTRVEVALPAPAKGQDGALPEGDLPEGE